MIPDVFLEHETSARFWTDMCGLTDPESDREDGVYRTVYGGGDQTLRCQWTLPGGYGIRVDFDAALSATLFLVQENQVFELGWDDQSHWHPHVLRRCELELLCRAIALENLGSPDSAHPGWPVRLLDRFAPVCDADDPNVAYASFYAAHRLGSELPDDVIAQLASRSDSRGAGFVWTDHENHGWVIDQADRDGARRGLYSLRQPPVERSPEKEAALAMLRERGLMGPESRFPFEEWSGCLAEIEQRTKRIQDIASASEDAKLFAETGEDDLRRLMISSVEEAGFDDLAELARQSLAGSVWIAENLIGFEVGDIMPLCTEPFEVPHFDGVSIHYGEPEEPGLNESALFSHLFTSGLDAMLRDRRCGTSQFMSGGHKTLPDGREISTGRHDSVQFRLPEDELIDLIRQWFSFGGGPRSGPDGKQRPTLTRGSFSGEIDVDLFEAPVGRIQLNLVRLVVARKPHEIAVRREALADSDRDVACGKLVTAGWNAHWRRLADTGDGITLDIHRLHDEAVTVLWEVMAEHRLVMLPHSIVATSRATDGFEAYRSTIRLAESPKQLFGLLDRAGKS
ncbi:MAG: hypothetical protein AAFX06_27545 [Planctomycetota bacterium]